MHCDLCPPTLAVWALLGLVGVRVPAHHLEEQDPGGGDRRGCFRFFVVIVVVVVVAWLKLKAGTFEN